MSYVSRSLAAGERVIHHGRLHWIYTLAAMMSLIPPLTPIGLILLINRWTTEIAVTNRRLIYKRGWIVRRTDEISLGRLEEINLRQSVVGRILGYGTLICRGVGSGEISLPSIRRPLDFRRALQEAQGD